eukprot:703883-Rhodomonas_salina.3
MVRPQPMCLFAWWDEPSAFYFQVNSASRLRACYAMSGTAKAYAALLSCYAMSGTEIAYGMVRRYRPTRLLRDVRY